MKWWLTLALCLTACSRTMSEPAPLAEEIRVGSPFPNLLLPDLDGRAASVAAMRGRKLILHIFASW